MGNEISAVVLKVLIALIIGMTARLINSDFDTAADCGQYTMPKAKRT